MDIGKQVKIWREQLHQIPEVGLQEIKTAAYLRQELSKMGYTPIEIMNTGTLVYIDYGKEETLAFRSDIDGLAMLEKNNVSYASKHQGYMHACGHDGHMAALLAFAMRLKDCLDVRYNILLIFQPAEESPGGAKNIVEQGVLDTYHVKAIFGMHLMPFLEKGVIASKAGPLMAQNGELDVTITGKSAHVGLYHQGIDSIIIASQLINEYQTIITRMISPFEQCVLHVGSIQGGSSRNIVAEETTFRGTLRTYNNETFLQITKAIEAINRAKEKVYDCKITCTCPPMYPAVVNDYRLYPKFLSCISGKYQELHEPMMLAEDFSYYQTKRPGIFFYLGTKSDIYYSGLHTEKFNFEEDVLLTAVDTYVSIATNLQLGDE